MPMREGKWRLLIGTNFSSFHFGAVDLKQPPQSKVFVVQASAEPERQKE